MHTACRDLPSPRRSQAVFVYISCSARSPGRAAAALSLLIGKAAVTAEGLYGAMLGGRAKCGGGEATQYISAAQDSAEASR